MRTLNLCFVFNGIHLPCYKTCYKLINYDYYILLQNINYFTLWYNISLFLEETTLCYGFNFF